MMAMRAGYVAATQVESGELSVHIDVSGVFELAR